MLKTKYMNNFLRASLPLFAFYLSGCATTQAPEPIKQPIPLSSSACTDMAKYAKSVEFLREAGIPQHELDAYVKVPVALVVPMSALQAQVHAKNYSNPSQAYSDVLAQCNAVGWQAMLQLMTDQFPSAALKMDTTLENIPEVKSVTSKAKRRKR